MTLSKKPELHTSEESFKPSIDILDDTSYGSLDDLVENNEELWPHHEVAIENALLKIEQINWLDPWTLWESNKLPKPLVYNKETWLIWYTLKTDTAIKVYKTYLNDDCTTLQLPKSDQIWETKLMENYLYGKKLHDLPLLSTLDRSWKDKFLNVLAENNITFGNIYVETSAWKVVSISNAPNTKKNQESDDFKKIEFPYRKGVTNANQFLDELIELNQ